MTSTSRRHIERLTISLPAELAEAVREAVESRRFASASEVIRDALREWRLGESASAPGHGKRVRRARVCADLSQLQLAEITTSAKFRRIVRFAVRGSAQKRVVEGAVSFQPPLPYGHTPEEARRLLESYLTYHWRQVVKLVAFEAVDDKTEWTVVYEADLPRP